MSDTGLVQIIEGALLAAGKALTVAQIADLFEAHERPENTAIREALKEVAERCEDRGFELQEVASGFRFQVRQSLSSWVARLWHERPQKYSRALLEKETKRKRSPGFSFSRAFITPFLRV